MNYGHWTLMKFHRGALISNTSYTSMSTCPLGANQPFEGLIRLSICCQLCSFSTDCRHLGQVIPVTKLICIQASCNQDADKNNSEPLWLHDGSLHSLGHSRHRASRLEPSNPLRPHTTSKQANTTDYGLSWTILYAS